MFLPLVCTDDVQQKPALGYCARCGKDLYSYDDGDICTECREEIKEPETVVKYAEAWPRRWFKFMYDVIGEDFMKQALKEFKDYCVGFDKETNSPDFESWAES